MLNFLSLILSFFAISFDATETLTINNEKKLSQPHFLINAYGIYIKYTHMMCNI